MTTDVEGSTDLWEWDKEAMMEATSIHDSILRTHLPGFYGYEVSTEVWGALCTACSSDGSVETSHSVSGDAALHIRLRLTS